MKRQWFFLVTLLALLLLCFCTLARVGHLRAQHETTELSGSLTTASLLEVRNPFVSPSGLRWQQGLPSHWRACLLQR
jgi:hypothetical protein